MNESTVELVFHEVLTLARALADTNRLKIFLALRTAERCVRDLVDSQNLSQPLVSHHLSILLSAGLVQTRWSHGFKLYALSPDGLGAARVMAMTVLDPTSVDSTALPGGNTDCCQ